MNILYTSHFNLVNAVPLKYTDLWKTNEYFIIVTITIAFI